MRPSATADRSSFAQKEASSSLLRGERDSSGGESNPTRRGGDGMGGRAGKSCYQMNKRHSTCSTKKCYDVYI